MVRSASCSGVLESAGGTANLSFASLFPDSHLRPATECTIRDMPSSADKPQLPRDFPRTRSDEGASTRKPTNLTLAVSLVTEARELGVNLSQAAEAGIADAVRRMRQERWLTENQAALDSSNAFVERRGLPLEQYRNF